jgi:hypothetical protein
MVMRLNPTELCSYAIAALIVIATITVATWIVMTVWSSAPLPMNVGVNDGITHLWPIGARTGKA